MLRIVVHQFSSAVVLLLLVASLVSAGLGKVVEAAAIAAALLLNAAIGSVTELRATKSMEALRKIGRPTSRVRRDGVEKEVLSEKIVPGDVVLLSEGDVIPADLRLVEVENLECDESALTGESVPVEKQTEAVDDAPLAERRHMAFRGTTVSRGAAEGVVEAIGMDTELGRIAKMVDDAEESATPLERRLDRLAHRLLWLVLVLGVLLASAGIAAGQNPELMIETAVLLAIAAVPEGLPIVSTVALARGMWRMAARNAIVNRLSSVETLGATSVILVDKTGTLTENRMAVHRLWLPDGEIAVNRDADGRPSLEIDGEPTEVGDPVMRLVRAGALCTNAEPANGEEEAARGEPMEVALIELAAGLDAPRRALLEEMPEVREEAFSPATKMMATFHDIDDGVLVAVKGAPEAVLDACETIAVGERTDDLGDADREAWLTRSRELGESGLRVLAIADRHATTKDEEPYEALVFLGLVGFRDPPRRGVHDTLRRCRDAGVRVVMVTGDQPETARSIGEELGLVSERAPRDVVLSGREVDEGVISGARPLDHAILARVSPEQKLGVVRRFQDEGEVVGMTGDGVNDAPALERADIGTAMGDRGTQAAREAGDIILEDDALGTIVHAIEQGRNIFENIRRFIVYLLSGNLGEILAVGVAALFAAPLPLLPLQILFINVVFDVFPALALGVSAGSEDVMNRPPRPADEPVLTRRHWVLVGVFGTVIAASVLGVFGVALHVLGLPEEEAVTISFLAFGFARLLHVFSMRDAHEPILVNQITRNPWVWCAVIGCAGALVVLPFVPGLGVLLGVVMLDGRGWLLVGVGAAATLVLGQLVLAVERARW